MIDEKELDTFFKDVQDKPKKVHCHTCRNVEASIIIEQIVDHMIATGQDAPIVDIHVLLKAKANYTNSQSNLAKHLNNCLRAKWKRAKHG